MILHRGCWWIGAQLAPVHLQPPWRTTGLDIHRHIYSSTLENQSMAKSSRLIDAMWRHRSGSTLVSNHTISLGKLQPFCLVCTYLNTLSWSNADIIISFWGQWYIKIDFQTAHNYTPRDALTRAVHLISTWESTSHIIHGMQKKRPHLLVSLCYIYSGVYVLFSFHCSLNTHVAII